MYDYYMLGRSVDVARLGTSALMLVPKMSFKERTRFYLNAGLPDYIRTMEALAGAPKGSEQIAAINTALRAAAIPSPELVALDTGFKMLGRWFVSSIEDGIAMSALLGTRASPLIANYWVNRTTRDSATIPVNDGKIRIIYLASIFCPGCLAEAVSLKRIMHQFPEVEVNFLTSTTGSWSNRLVDAEEEAAHLAEFLVTKKKIDYPIGIWKCKKVLNADGGMAPEEGDTGPNGRNYKGAGPFVIDGQGIVRRVFTVGGRDVDVQAVRTVQFLMAEASARSSAQASIPAPQ